MMLADYHSRQDGYAWPSQRMLAEDCEVDERTVRRCLNTLEAQGFITTVQKGNQYQPTKYLLHFAMSGAQSYEPDKSEPDKIAGASEPDNPGKVNRTIQVSEPDTPRMTNLQEPTVEPTISIQGEHQGFSENGV